MIDHSNKVSITKRFYINKVPMWNFRVLVSHLYFTYTILLLKKRNSDIHTPSHTGSLYAVNKRDRNKEGHLFTEIQECGDFSSESTHWSSSLLLNFNVVFLNGMICSVYVLLHRVLLYSLYQRLVDERKDLKQDRTCFKWTYTEEAVD